MSLELIMANEINELRTTKEIQMPQLQRIRILECSGCSCRIVLPNRSPQGKPFVRPNWPTDAEMLTVVCHSCGRLSDYSESQARYEEIPADDQTLQTRTFRLVEFACDQKNCEGRIRVHLETEINDTDAAIKNRVLTASPQAGHEEKHFLTANCALVRNDVYHY